MKNKTTQNETIPQLSRQQELFLIELGLKSLLSAARIYTTQNEGAFQIEQFEHKSRARPSTENETEAPKGKKWSASHRAKFKRTMKKVWAEKRALKAAQLAATHTKK